MDHGHVVAAFRTSGEVPRKGARVSELLLVKLSEGGRETARLRLPAGESAAQAGPALTGTHFSRLVEFTGTATVVTHDGYNWKRFLRQEFASESKDQVKDFLARTVDVSEWSARRFPKQRKEVEAICKRLNIALPPEVTGTELEVIAVGKLIPHLSTDSMAPTAVAAKRAPSPPAAPKARQARQTIAVRAPATEPFHIRLRRAWAVLLGNQH